MANNREEIKDSKVALVAHIVVSIIYIALGACQLAFDTSYITTFVYSFLSLTVGILFIVFGAWYMIKYFFNHEYTKITHYGFTMGVILVVIGSIFIFQANYISTFIDVLVCLIGVVIGAIMLQQSFALFHISRGIWFLSFIFGIAAIGTSIFFVMTPVKFFQSELIPCVYLISVGSVSLLSLIFMVIGLHNHKKDSELLYNRNMEDAPGKSKSAVDDSIFEEEAAATFTEEKKEAVPDSLFEE